jgi:uncharacterized membrane protein affecting hemolysin expression
VTFRFRLCVCVCVCVHARVCVCVLIIQIISSFSLSKDWRKEGQGKRTGCVGY